MHTLLQQPQLQLLHPPTAGHQAHQAHQDTYTQPVPLEQYQIPTTDIHQTQQVDSFQQHQHKLTTQLVLNQPQFIELQVICTNDLCFEHLFYLSFYFNLFCSSL